MSNEKIMELSTQILCALIREGFLPVAIRGKHADIAAGMVHDFLFSIAKEVGVVYERLEEDRHEDPNT